MEQIWSFRHAAASAVCKNRKYRKATEKPARLQLDRVEKKLEYDLSDQGIHWSLVLNNVQNAIDLEKIPVKRCYTFFFKSLFQLQIEF